jgi:hypothetical protein
LGFGACGGGYNVAVARQAKNNFGPEAGMNYKREAEAPVSHPPEQAIRPAPFPGNIGQRMITRRSSGWDPYEVWRTRVKAPRDRAVEPLDLGKVG